MSLPLSSQIFVDSRLLQTKKDKPRLICCQQTPKGAIRRPYRVENTSTQHSLGLLVLYSKTEILFSNGKTEKN